MQIYYGRTARGILKAVEEYIVKKSRSWEKGDAWWKNEVSEAAECKIFLKIQKKTLQKDRTMDKEGRKQREEEQVVNLYCKYYKWL